MTAFDLSLQDWIKAISHVEHGICESVQACYLFVRHGLALSWFLPFIQDDRAEFRGGSHLHKVMIAVAHPPLIEAVCIASAVNSRFEHPVEVVVPFDPKLNRVDFRSELVFWIARLAIAVATGASVAGGRHRHVSLFALFVAFSRHYNHLSTARKVILSAYFRIRSQVLMDYGFPFDEVFSFARLFRAFAAALEAFLARATFWALVIFSAARLPSSAMRSLRSLLLIPFQRA
jgi:hypothetical protein